MVGMNILEGVICVVADIWQLTKIISDENSAKSSIAEVSQINIISLADLQDHFGLKLILFLIIRFTRINRSMCLLGSPLEYL